jgi:hypothetical protein
MVTRPEMTLKENTSVHGTKQLYAAPRIIRCSSGYLSAGPLHQFNAEFTAHSTGGSGQGLERDRAVSWVNFPLGVRCNRTLFLG